VSLQKPLPFACVASLVALACSANGAPEPVAPPITPGADAAPEATVLEVGPSDSPAMCLQDDAAIAVLPEQDWDQDGWSLAQGDCNDCDPNTNPGAFDVPGNGVDEDCSALADDEPAECDDGIAIAANDAKDGARALGICRFVQEQPLDPRDRRWGVVEASYVLADGSAGMHYASHGVLADFGPYVHPQQGGALLALSTGTARRPADPAYQPAEESNMGTSAAAPSGWPKASPSCPQPQANSPVANDSASLELRVRVPTNARSLSFQLNFYTAEFPRYVCNQYNDFFVALLWSQVTSSQAQDGNISFDALGNPISVNTAFLDVCQAQVAGGRTFECRLGNAGLVGNGFDTSQRDPRGHAATGWLKTSAAVAAGELLRIRFAVWDGGDHLRSSTVLLDAFQWDAQPGTDPVTVRVQNPK
jgi:hypothetical protein